MVAVPGRGRDRRGSEIAVLHVGGDRLLRIGGSRSPSKATRCSPNQIARRSRSAGSPALPTAITTRPQLASSPASAVFTSGEFPIESAIFRAEASDVRARDLDLDELRQSLAVARHLLGKVAAEVGKRRWNAAKACRSASRVGTPCAKPHPGREGEQRVGGRGVAVDCDGVEALRTAAERHACRAAAPIGASVKTKESIVAMSGAIMPAPLAMPTRTMLAAADPDASASRPSETCRWS